MISVILPVYNGEAYIATAIESVLKQSEPDFEFIIVDDGSTDNTFDIIQTYQSDSRLKIYRQKNSGPGAARNFAMSIAKGTYFSFIDADDAYMPNKLQIQKEILDTHTDISVIWGDYYLTDSNMSHLQQISPSYITQKRENMLAYMLFRNLIPNPQCMFRRECYDSGFRYNETFRHDEDYYLFLQLLKQYNFYYLNIPLYIYRKHDKNLSNNVKAINQAMSEILSAYTPNMIDTILDNTDFPPTEKLRLKGKIYMRKKEYSPAFSCFMKILSSHENDWSDYFYLGNLNYLLENYDEAIQYYLQAIQLNSSIPELYNNLGCAYGHSNTDSADTLCIKQLEYALHLLPMYQDAKHNLSNVKSQIQNEPYHLTIFELRH